MNTVVRTKIFAVSLSAIAPASGALLTGSGATATTQASPQPAGQSAQAPAAKAALGTDTTTDTSDDGGVRMLPILPMTSIIPGRDGSADTTIIVSPSGNIGCQFSEYYAGCGLLSYRQDAPFGYDETGGTPLWWFDMSGGAKPELIGSHEGSPALDASMRRAGDPEPQVVEYTETVIYGPWQCHSDTAALNCWNNDTNHGVVMSREQYRTY